VICSPQDEARQVSLFLEDFAPLRTLPAFAELEGEVRAVVEGQSWDR